MDQQANRGLKTSITCLISIDKLRQATASISRFRVFPGWFRDIFEVDRVREETNQLLQSVYV